MAKDAIYHEEAQRLFVIEGYSLDAIVVMLKEEVSRKTLFNWKTKYKWDEKRKNYLNSTKSLQEDLLEIAKTAIKEAKVNPTPHNIYAVTKAIGALKLLQGAGLPDGQDEAEEKDKKPKSISQETISFIEKEILGIK
ncbi:MAG: hypothetical protein HF314_12055 [Ignavibacteria bacterium]|jgi:hypothetical protein|nr:hypothetical protein [Ignavibacteria bacterium]MCU7503804.1 hypothetical protein [Ignavibacteria bacterium]MCU7517182.1 hypothetical protein [Ignavibacteria bacterium]